MSELATFHRKRTLSWLWIVLLFIALKDAISSFIVFALPYLRYNPEFLARFDERQRFWLLSHIAGGSIALIVGPFQLWMGLTRRYMWIHRKTGMLYLVSVAVASVGAFYLAATTRRGPVFGSALGSLGLAWIISVGLAYVAVRRRMFAQHQEWMIRSYVITFSFVTFRMVVGVLNYFEMGHRTEHVNVASWLSWVVPLLLTEAIIQGRKIFARKVAAPSRVIDPGRSANEIVAEDEIQTSPAADSYS
jgi:hypothetical protein